MSDGYATTGDQTVSTGYLSVLGITSATTVRPRITFFSFGAIGTPADNALQWLLQRYTAAGTATSVTPEPLDPDAPAALASSGSNHTAEPTYTSGGEVLDIGVAQRNTYQWYGDVNPIMLPATANNGAGWQVKNGTYTGDVTVTAHFTH